MKKSAVVLLGLLVCGMGIIEAGWKLTGVPLASVPAPGARNYGALWYDTTNNAAQISTDAGLRQVFAGRFLYDVFHIGAATTATTYSGSVPEDRITIVQAGFRVTAAGTGGTTGEVLRVTDGTLNCDFGLPCNSAIGYYSLDAGNPSTGCSFAPASNLTYSVSSIGNCATGLTIGTVKLRGLKR